MERRKQYTEEFRHEVLRMAENTEKPIRELEMDLGLSQGLIRQWQQRYRADEATATLRPISEREAEAEIRRLKRELEIVTQERDILKKAIQVFSREQPPMKYWFIESHWAVCPVGRMCRVLGVSRSGYYAWREHPLSERKQSNTRLLLYIRAVYHESRRTYGSRRVYHKLREQGIPCSRHRIARLMRQDGLRAVQRQRYKQTTRPNPRLPIAPNVLNRDFTAQRPNQKWVADFTYIPTAQRWLYLATVMDVFSRQIVGWSMSERQQTALVEDALQIARRCPQPACCITLTVAVSMPAAITRSC